MSGHSKWHSIKHQKGAADAARGKLFARLARQIEVAARDGGGDIEANPTLRTMVQKARDASMPKDNIERAIKRGHRRARGRHATRASPTRATPPNGVAVYVEALTDNRNRTGAEIKNVFTRNGGSLAEPGAVAWQFERKGVIILRQGGRHRGRPHARRARRRRRGHRRPGRHLAGHHRAHRPARGAHRARGGRDRGHERRPHDAAEPRPSRSTRPSAAKSVLRVIDALEEHDDVQNVYANFDIPDEVLAAVYA